MLKKSFKQRQNELANTERQLEILSNGIFDNNELPTFVESLKTVNEFPL
jgi:hypothetical protein